MSIVLDGTANTVTPLNGALGGTTPSTVVATTVVASSTIKGATTIAVGNATPSASGAGITFPATQSASTDANTLDDYEEGTWTPVTRNSLEAVTINAATYTKVGRLVTAYCDIIFPATPASQANGGIGGLPFAAGSGGGSGFISLASAGSTIRSLYMGAANTAGLFTTFASASVNNNTLGNVEFEVTFIYMV